MVRPAMRRWVRAAACGVGATVLVSIVLRPGDRVAGQAPAPPPSAPQAAAPQPNQPTFRLGANYVRVDVYPTRGGEAAQDLDRADFELLEDGVPQTIEQFERISLQTAVDPAARRDPNTVAEAREQAADPRRRVFIVFLDTGMTTIEGSYAARKPIIEMLDRLIGYDDLFAVMTPDMRGSDIAFARRTEGLDAELAKYWTWGQRDAIARSDPEELEIETCFPDPAPEKRCKLPDGRWVVQPPNAYRGVATQLIERRSEQRALAALDDLVSYLGAVREERKAVIVVTQGWRLLEPKSQLTKLQECDQAPDAGRPGVSPGGVLVPDAGSAHDPRSKQPSQCMATAMQYALADNNRSFHDLIERANRFNVSFYPFDTRGLQIFDRSIGARDDRIRVDPGEKSDVTRGGLGGPLERDTNRTLDRVQSLQTLADATDGLAVVNTNDLGSGARRIVNDLSTYYLLGYQSTNTRLDGKWRNITVRVKTPGIQVRARKGYRALTEREVSILSRGGSAPGTGGKGAASQTPAAAAATALSAAIAPLAGLDRPLPWHSRAAWGYAGAGDPGVRFWVASEIDEATMQGSEWAGGGTWTATLTAMDGTRIAERSAPLAAGARSIEASLAGDIPDGADVMVRLRLSPAGGGLPLSDALRVTPSGTSARLFRSGLTTSRRFVAAGDQRFRRSDRARVAVAVADASVAVEAALLDRAGTALKIPVAARVETIDGAPCAVGEIALAPLSPGDYVVRLVAGQSDRALTSLTGIRIVN
jgi:VWFA-related protein